MIELSVYYEKGIWIKKDIQQAKSLLQDAIKLGSITAQWKLEIMEIEE